MTNTASRATLDVPYDVFALLRETFGELAQEHRIILHIGRAQGSDEGIDMDGIILVPDREQDLYLASSGDCSDHDTALGEEAFTAGYRAATMGEDLSEAWNAFTPTLHYDHMSRWNRDVS